MKLREDFIVQDIDDAQFLVPVGAEAFSGMVRGNKTAAFIVNCLKEETTEAAIIDSMCRKYDAPRATIAADVAKALKILRSVNAIEE